MNLIVVAATTKGFNFRIKKISNGILGGEGEGEGAGVSLTWFDCILYLTDLNYLSEIELRIVNSKL